jgi:hypothetical protein
MMGDVPDDELRKVREERRARTTPIAQIADSIQNIQQSMSDDDDVIIEMEFYYRRREWAMDHAMRAFLGNDIQLDDIESMAERIYKWVMEEEK